MNLEEEIFFLPYKDSSEKGRSKEGNTHAHTHRRNIMNTLGHCFTKLEVEFSLLWSGCLTYLIQKWMKRRRPSLAPRKLMTSSFKS